MSNISYGGITYPKSPFSFDKFYFNYDAAKDAAASDGILIGRYVLITYCNDPLTYGERYDLDRYVLEDIELPSSYYQKNEDGTITENLKTKYDNYITNFRQDKNNQEVPTSYDRMVLQKVYQNRSFTYIPIVSLSLSLSETTHAVAGVVVSAEDNKSILTLDDNKILSSDIGIELSEDHKTISLVSGTDNRVIDSIDTSSFLIDGIFNSIEIDDANKIIKFSWTNYDENGIASSQSKEVDLDNILKPYSSGAGIEIENLDGENYIKVQLDKTSQGAEQFLSVSDNGLKISGVQNAINSTVDTEVGRSNERISENEKGIENLNNKVASLEIQLADEIQISETAETMVDTATMQIIINGDIGDGPQSNVYALELEDYDTKEEVNSKINTAIQNLEAELENYDTREEVNSKIDTAIQNLETSVTNKVSGEFLTITDASSIEHLMDVRVRSKNLFDISKVNSYKPNWTTNQFSVDYEEQTISVTTPEGNGIADPNITLKKVAPELEVGKTYRINFNRTITENKDNITPTDYAIIHIDAIAKNWIISGETTWSSGNGVKTLTMTEEILNSTFGWYAAGKNTTVKLSNIQIYEADMYDIINKKGPDYVPYTKVEDVTLTRRGKNLFNPNRETSGKLALSAGAGTVKVAYDKTTDIYTLNGTSTVSNGDGSICYLASPLINTATAELVGLKSDTNYVLSVKILSGEVKIPEGVSGVTAGLFLCPSNASTPIYICNLNEAKSGDTIFSSKQNSTADLLAGIRCYFYASKSNVEFNNLKLQIQFEEGVEGTEYEPYNGIQYIPNTDGTVEGVTSLYPTTNLFTDTEGVLIDCKYIQNLGVDYSAEQVLVNRNKINELEEQIVQADWSVEDETSDAFIKQKPTKLSQFENNKGYLSGTVAIGNGGTGATTAEDARDNLGITPANIGAVAISKDNNNKILPTTQDIKDSIDNKVTISKDGNTPILPTTQDIKNTIDNIPYNVSIVSTTNDDDIDNDSVIKRYTITQGSTEVGTIDIPKDLVVSGGSVKTISEKDNPYKGAEIGDTYIELIIANGQPLYIPANSLVDTYTVSSAQEGPVIIAISEENLISATIQDNSIIEDYLDSDIKDKLHIIINEIYPIVFDQDDWEQYPSNSGIFKIEATVNGVLETDNPIIDLSFDINNNLILSNIQAVQENWSHILLIETKLDKLIFYSDDPFTFVPNETVFSIKYQVVR